MSLKSYWLQIPLTTRKEIISGIVTFASVFLTTFGGALQVDMPMTWPVVVAAATVALRVAVKTLATWLVQRYEGRS